MIAAIYYSLQCTGAKYSETNYKQFQYKLTTAKSGHGVAEQRRENVEVPVQPPVERALLF